MIVSRWGFYSPIPSRFVLPSYLMYLCYIDESGTPDIPGNTSHFILAGLAIPIWHWTTCDKEIYFIKRKYELEKAEIHVAWMVRRYPEQEDITDFHLLDYSQRRSQVNSIRVSKQLELQRKGYSKAYQRNKKFYRATDDYIHLTYTERSNCIKEIAHCISGWGFARLFAEAIDKTHFDPSRAPSPVDVQAFEQIVSRFERYLQNISKGSEGDEPALEEPPKPVFGLLIHDNNQTIAKKHTQIMKGFHFRGTLWTTIKNIIETPLFVDSALTSMVQMSDLCAYALRRYLENGEEELFDLVFKRADRKGAATVGVRHFADQEVCVCKICDSHKPKPLTAVAPSVGDQVTVTVSTTAVSVSMVPPTADPNGEHES